MTTRPKGDTMTESRTEEIAIYYRPSRVPVGDDRGEVDGAWVLYTRGDREISGDIIPREGDSLDCWLDTDFACVSLTPEEVDALDDAANRGAAGETGTLYVETEETT